MLYICTNHSTHFSVTYNFTVVRCSNIDCGAGGNCVVNNRGQARCRCNEGFVLNRITQACEGRSACDDGMGWGALTNILKVSDILTFYIGPSTCKLFGK